MANKNKFHKLITTYFFTFQKNPYFFFFFVVLIFSFSLILIFVSLRPFHLTISSMGTMSFCAANGAFTVHGKTVPAAFSMPPRHPILVTSSRSAPLNIRNMRQSYTKRKALANTSTPTVCT